MVTPLHRQPEHRIVVDLGLCQACQAALLLCDVQVRGRTDGSCVAWRSLLARSVRRRHTTGKIKNYRCAARYMHDVWRGTRLHYYVVCNVCLAGCCLFWCVFLVYYDFSGKPISWQERERERVKYDPEENYNQYQDTPKHTLPTHQKRQLHTHTY